MSAGGVGRTTNTDRWNLPAYWIALPIGVVFAICAMALVFTKRPWVDEAWFTGPALDLVTHGRFGTLLLDPAGSHLRLYKPDAFLRGINQRTYWVMPLHLLQLAGWGKLFGFGVFSMRMPSLLWGGVALASVASVVRRLYGGRGAALVAASILAVDFGFVNGAAGARMDMTGAALGLAALAVYLRLRETHFGRAAIAAHALAACAVFVHPNGIFATAGLMLTMLWLDWKRVRPLTVALIGAPYLLLGLFWAIYCLQAPADFVAQFSANTAARGSDLLAPWRGVWREIAGRYVTHFWPAGSVAGKFKVVGIVVYGAGLGILLFARTLRRTNGCRLLLCVTLLQFLCLSILASTKNTYYMVYILPYFAAAAGIASSYVWTSFGTRARVLCTAALVTYAAVQVAALINLSVVTSGYRKEFLPAAAYLKSTLQPDDLVTGAAELGFSLGFENPQLADDAWLGYWSGRRPTVVVIDRWYYEQVIEGATARGFPRPGYFATFLQSFDLVRESKGYRIYRRRAAPSSP